MPLFEFGKEPPLGPSNFDQLRMGVKALLAEQKIAFDLPPPPDTMAEILFTEVAQDDRKFPCPPTVRPTFQKGAHASRTAGAKGAPWGKGPGKYGGSVQGTNGKSGSFTGQQHGLNSMQNSEGVQGLNPGQSGGKSMGSVQGTGTLNTQSFGSVQGPNNGFGSTPRAPNAQSFAAIQGGPNAQSFGSVQGAPNAQNFGSVQGAPDTQSFGAVQGAPNAQSFGSVQGANNAFGSTPRAPNAQSYGSVQGAPNAQSFGSVQGAPNAQSFGSVQGANNSFGSTPKAPNAQSFGSTPGAPNAQSFDFVGGANMPQNFGSTPRANTTQGLGSTPGAPNAQSFNFVGGANMPQNFGSTPRANAAQSSGVRGALKGQSFTSTPRASNTQSLSLQGANAQSFGSVSANAQSSQVVGSSSRDWMGPMQQVASRGTKPTTQETRALPSTAVASTAKKSRKQPLPTHWDARLARHLAGELWTSTFPVEELHDRTPLRVFLSEPRADCAVVRLERPGNVVRTFVTELDAIWQALSNAKPHIEVVAFQCGWIPGPAMDVSLMAWALFPENGKEFDKLAAVAHFMQIPGRDTVMEYDIQRLAEVYAKLYEPLTSNPQLQHMFRHIVQVEQPVARLLHRMKECGVPFKRSVLEEAQEILACEVVGLEERWKDCTQREINLCSPKQVGDFLFDELKLPTATRSTDEEALQAIAHSHPCIRVLMEHRKVTKMLSTFVKPFLEYSGERIHADFCQMATFTGRLSCRNPNLQQLPRDALSTEVDIRRSIACDDGKCLVSMDYSQIEVRMLAHFVGKGKLQGTFVDMAADVYAEVAKQILGKQDIAADERSAAKTVLLALFYGSGNHVVAKQLKVTPKRAGEFTQLLLKTYPEVVSWKNAVVARAKSDGYCETISRRRRMLPNLNSPDHSARAEAERQCVNTIVQGSAADLLKKAMLLCDDKLKAFPAQLVLSVHDELIFETATSCVEDVTRIMHESMLQVGRDATVGYMLSVPLAVHIKRGPSWGEM